MITSKKRRTGMTAKELEKKITSVGYKFERMSGGSHRQYKHPDRPELISIPFHGSKDLKLGTLNQILKQAGLK
jgi:predicted RNA binding protein YcfA (HicA-like mRNA interferase family)